MGHVVTTSVVGTFTQVGGGNCEYTQAVDTGTGSNRVFVFSFTRRSDRSPVINSITIGGEALTVLSTDLSLSISTTGISRCAVRLNPSVTGTQNIVINCTTNGSDGYVFGMLSVYDNVDPNASPSSLLAAEAYQLVGTPWSQSANFNIPSATGHTAVVQAHGISVDVEITGTANGYTSRLARHSPDNNNWAGDAAGAATVTVYWTYNSTLSSDLGITQYGFSLPPPSEGDSGGIIRQYANGAFQSPQFVESAGPAMRMFANGMVQIVEMQEIAISLNKLHANGSYVSPLFIETP